MKKAVSFALNFGGDDETPEPIPEQHAEVRHPSHLASALAEEWWNRDGQMSDEEVGITITWDDGTSDTFDVDIEHDVSFHAHQRPGK